MKKFKSFMAEHNTQVGGLSSTHIPHDIDDAEVKAKINAVLGHTASSEYMNPQAAVEQMKAKLEQLGLAMMQHDDVEFNESGEFDLSFSRYGETFGKSVDTPHDEFEKEEKLVSLNVKYERLMNNSYKVYGSLV
tara:strand:- start:1130 stop:1531 length:402 start_codon:yes stop_codon:yes gene_type:complete